MKLQFVKTLFLILVNTVWFANAQNSSYIPSGYSLTFSDEFNTFELDKTGDGSANWAPWFVSWNARALDGNSDKAWKCDKDYVGGGTDPLGIDLHTVENGTVKLYSYKTPSNKLDNSYGYPYVGGMLSGEKSFSQQYGYWECKMKVKMGQGQHWAMWLLPIDASWPPEIDMVEVVGYETDVVHMNAHGSPENPPLTSIRNVDTWNYHTYGFEWTPTTMKYYLDGVLRKEIKNYVNKPMYWLISPEIAGNWPGLPDASTPWPTVCEIDYVRVYKHTGDTNTPPVVSIATPSDGSTYLKGENITISVNASDRDGSITKVEFYYDNTKISTDTNSPYAANWINIPVGNHTLTAKATDNNGSTTTSKAVNITVRNADGGGGGNNEIIVRAKNSKKGGSLELRLDDTTVASFNLTDEFKNFTYTTDVSLANIKTYFLDEIGDATVDYIQIAGKKYESEDQKTNTGVWQDGNCGGAYSEQLHCWGYIDFGAIAINGGSTQSTEINVRAAGFYSSGGTIQLLLDDQIMTSWKLTSSMQNYSYKTDLPSTNIKVNFLDDVGDAKIDYIEINGRKLQSEDQEINTGVWQDGNCGGAYSEQIHCKGYIDFGSQSLKTPILSAQKNVDKTEIKTFPNPFNTATTIAFTLEENSYVRLSIYDIAGRKIQTLIDQYKKPGQYLQEWKAVNDAENKIEQGIYFYELLITTKKETIKNSGSMLYTK